MPAGPLPPSAQTWVVAVQDLHRSGWTDAAIQAQVDARRWQRMGVGVVLLHNTAPDLLQRLRIALMSAPPGAAISHDSAAHLLGFGDAPSVVHVRAPMDFVHHRALSCGVPSQLHRSRVAPRLRSVQGLWVTAPEDTVVDLVSTARTDRDAVEAIQAACRARLTTPARVLARSSHYRGHIRIGVVRDVCSAFTDGVTTPLEGKYRADVERRHGLPPAARQSIAALGLLATQRDVEYAQWRVVIELDGRIGHESEPFRDRRRDNRNARIGWITLRYGWREIVGDPCAVAAEIAAVLAHAGWLGRLARCPRCRLEH